MTPEESRNLEVTRHWVATYNDDVERMVDECYAPDCVVENMATGDTYRGREALRTLERAISAAVPDRRMTAVRTIAAGDTVVVEATASGAQREPGARPTHACIVLTFRDGQIISDHTYVPSTAPPPVAGSPA